MSVPQNIFVSSMAPAEILRGFDVNLFYPENFAVALAYRRKLNSQKSNCNINENACSYALLDLNTNLFSSSNAELLIPDLLVYNTVQCLDIKYWFNYYAEVYQVPSIGIETPHLVAKNYDYVSNYIEKQLYQLIYNIEMRLNKEICLDKFKKSLVNSNESSLLWRKIQSYAENKPAYTDFFELCKLMAGIVLRRGTDDLIVEYNNILKVLEERRKNNIYISNTEKYRILWCGMPLWGNFKEIESIFMSLDAVIVASVYTQSWNFNFDLSNPIESIAKEYSFKFINLNDDDKLEYLAKLINEFSVDAVVFHHSVSCRRNCDNYYGISEKLKTMYNIPSITFEADHADFRKFDYKRFMVQLEALLDIVDKNRKRFIIGKVSSNE